MTSEKIYSYRAVNKIGRASGRICAVDMDHATEQVLDLTVSYGPMYLKITELRDQARAMNRWLKRKKK